MWPGILASIRRIFAFLHSSRARIYGIAVSLEARLERAGRSLITRTPEATFSVENSRVLIPGRPASTTRRADVGPRALMIAPGYIHPWARATLALSACMKAHTITKPTVRRSRPEPDPIVLYVGGIGNQLNRFFCEKFRRWASLWSEDVARLRGVIDTPQPMTYSPTRLRARCLRGYRTVREQLTYG